MLKIHHHFFLNFLILFIGTILVSAVIVYITIKSAIIEDSEDDLKHAISVLHAQIGTEGNLDALVMDFHKLTGIRVTVIDPDGVVIAESNTDKTDMENHSNRYEVMQSASNAYGVSTRYSNTLKTDFLYVAKRIDYKGQRITLRLSISLEKVFKSYATITSRLLFAIAFFVITAVAISYRLSLRIQYDIDEVINYLDKIGNKNYKAVIKTKYFSEFLLISLKLKNLMKKLRNREKQKRKYTAKLRLANKQRSDVLSAISHEFKNPVASIMGYAETLQDDPDIELKIRTKFLDKIFSNAKSISLMLDRLSLSIKLENDDIKLQKYEFDLCELTEEVVENLNKKYRNRTIEAKCESTMVYADKTTIEMVLINLVDNAMKYSEDDVVVTISDKHLSVIDHGIGIAPKEIDKISSKFYRVEKNSWDNSLGLGLSIVSYILGLHKTSLNIDSELHIGSTFSFDIAPLIKKS